MIADWLKFFGSKNRSSFKMAMALATSKIDWRRVQRDISKELWLRSSSSSSSFCMRACALSLSLSLSLSLFGLKICDLRVNY